MKLSKNQIRTFHVMLRFRIYKKALKAKQYDIALDVLKDLASLQKVYPFKR